MRPSLKTATPKYLPDATVCPSTFAISVTLTSIGLVTSLNSSFCSPAKAMLEVATTAAAPIRIPYRDCRMCVSSIATRVALLVRPAKKIVGTKGCDACRRHEGCLFFLAGNSAHSVSTAALTSLQQVPFERVDLDQRHSAIIV